MLGSVAQVRFYCWGLLLKSAFSVGVKLAFSVGVCYSSQHLPVGLVTHGSTLTGGLC